MATFNGETLIITLDPVVDGVLDVDVGIDLYTQWKTWAKLGNLRYPAAFRTTGGDELTSIINAGAYFFLRNDYGWRVKAYENDATYYLIGNLAVQDTTLPAFVPTSGAFTAAILGLQPVTQGVTPVMGEQLAYSSFNGGVTIDAILGYSGVGSLPDGRVIGTPSAPSNNIEDAHTILVERGFNKMFVVSNLAINTEDFGHGITFEGLSSLSTTLTLGAGTDVDNCIFRQFTIGGTLDNNNRLENCLIEAIDSFDGVMENCGISGGITMGGATQTTMVNCYSNVAGGNTTPYISIGSGSDLAIRGYKGGIELQDKTSTDAVSIDMESGQVVVAATCISGEVTLRGTGEIVDLSAGTYVRDFMSHNSDSARIYQAIEMLRPHHTGSGKIIYWDPFSGDDSRLGDHIDRAVKTFAQAHNLATNNGHDVIFAVSGNPTGVTTTNENITISKNYVFLRGPGRDFKIHSINDNLPAISITGNGVEVSSMVVSTEPTSSDYCIRSAGDFSLLQHLYVTDSVNGVYFGSGEYQELEHSRISHNSGEGMRVEGSAEHTTIRGSHIGGNGGDGVVVNTTTGHELLIDDSVIHNNAGYGITISAGVTDTIIRSNVIVDENAAGSVLDNGTNTIDLTERADLTLDMATEAAMNTQPV